MNENVSMSVTVVQVEGVDLPYAWVSVGEHTVPGSAKKIEFELPKLDDPADLLDFARQALAAVCEAL